MATAVDLGRLSRFETPETLAEIGAWAAVRNPKKLLDDAFKRTHATGVLPLLCVLDVILKFSQAVEKAVSPCVPGWLAQAARVMSTTYDDDSDGMVLYYNAAEALVLAWVAHGLATPACASAFSRLASDTRSRCHACQVCRRRFSNPHDCLRHTKLHVDAEAHARAAAEEMKGTTLGLFLGFEEKRKTVAALKMRVPMRACSPVAIRPKDARACPRCGDSFQKTFSDCHNDFMWENAARDAAGVLYHAGCVTSFFNCTA